jgi:hypothetical protein
VQDNAHDTRACGRSGSAITATGLVVTLIGAPLWANGTVDPAPTVTVGPASIDVRGAF